jgi:predicted membrane-bound mannosyltransferase
VVSLAVYSWAGEKFAWLVLHPLLPLIALAGLGVQFLWRSPRAPVRRTGAALTAVAAAYVVFASWSVNAVHRTDPRELLVSTQSSEDVLRIQERVVGLAERRRAGEPPLTVTIDTSQGATFPWAWYFRDLESVAFVDLSVPGGAPPASDVLVATDASRERLQTQLAGYDATRFGFRVWWVRDYRRLRPGSAIEWVATRRPWSPTGGMDQWLLVRRGA